MNLSKWTTWSNYSFRAQLFLILTILTAVVTFISTFALISYERRSYQQQLNQDGHVLATFLTRELQLPLYAENNEEVARLTAQMFAYNTINAIRVFNGKNEIVAEASRYPSVWEEKPLSVTDTVNSTNSSFSPEAQLLGEWLPNGGKIGSVELALNPLTITDQLHNFIRMATVFALSFWVTTTVICFLILRHMTRALSLLLEGIGKIAAGDLKSRIVVTDSAETGRAAASINKLAETLQLRDEENHRLQMEKVKSLRLEIDEEKTKHMAKLIQTNRMTSLGLLVSSMAHEINNPNGTMRLAGEFLGRTWKDAEPILDEIARDEGNFSLGGMPFSQAKEEIFKATDSISRSSTRIERVVQNLRSYSLGDRIEIREDVDLNRVASSALAIVRAHSQQSDINIATIFDPDLPLISGNPFQIEQVLTNLLLNAIQSLPPSGSRRVFLTTEWQQYDNSVTVEVRDEGQGIPAEQIPYLCEPFFTTRVNMGGSGLGLYISNYIVTEHKGRLEFSSKMGAGTTVTIHLPVKRGD